MKVLIICNDFPPLNSIGGQRPYSWLKYFHSQGVETTVVTKNWENCNSSTPLELIESLPLIESVIEELDEGIVYKEAHKLIFPDKIILKYGLNRYSFLRKTFTLIYQIGAFLFECFDKQIPLYKRAKKLVEQNDFDFVITTGEPFILFKYGYRLSKKYNVKWIADYRDGWCLNHVKSKKKGFLSKFLLNYEFLFEKKYLKKADLITSVDPHLTKRLGKLHRRESLCIYNGYWNIEQNETLPGLDRKLRLTHSGTLTPGQRVEFLLESVSELIEGGEIREDEVELRFVGLDYFRDQSARVKTYINELNTVITTTQRVSRDRSMIYNLQSDYLLSFTEKNYDAIYTKTYDYIACKRPILVIPNDNSLLEEMVRTYNVGYCFDEKKELKKFILNGVLNKRKGKPVKDSATDLEGVKFFSRQNQTKLFVNALKNRRSQ